MADFRLIRQLWERSPQQNYLSWRRRQTGQGLATVDAHHPLIFVLSTGRVGTQTVAALAGLAPGLVARHEPSPRLYGLGKLSYTLGNSAEAQQVLAAAIQTARYELFELAAVTGQGYVETSPQVTFLAPVLRQLRPEARFIHLVRAPESVVRSAMRRQWFAGNRADETRIVPVAADPFAMQWPDWSTLQKNYWLWAETNRWISAFGTTVPAGQFVRLCSDDLFAAQPAAIGALYGLLNRPVPATPKLQRILRQNLNAQRGGDYQPPADLARALGPTLHQFVASTAAALNLPFDGATHGD
ncbi:MAG: sulfotransferase [Anaerolineales bacterium]|nr:sulfotransferase [Anaerolineales bacterium]